MNKTIAVPRETKIKKPARKKPPAKVELNPEQLVQLAAVRAIEKFKREQWARMTPKERREETEAWKRIMKTINSERS